MAARKKTTKAKDRNEDPVTGEPGSHPVGTGIGAAAGGAVAGAGAGAVAGPIGAAIGAVVGGVAGGLAGKATAEAMDPTAEDAYWSKNYRSRPYVAKGSAYDDYRPAYRYGVEAHNRHGARGFDDVETEISEGWEGARGGSRLGWEEARPAVQDAYNRGSRMPPRRQPGSKVTGAVTGEPTVGMAVQREMVIEDTTVGQRAEEGRPGGETGIEVPVEGQQVRGGRRKAKQTDTAKGASRRSSSTQGGGKASS